MSAEAGRTGYRHTGLARTPLMSHPPRFAQGRAAAPGGESRSSLIAFRRSMRPSVWRRYLRFGRFMTELPGTMGRQLRQRGVELGS